jgi:hypothetical protein
VETALAAKAAPGERGAAGEERQEREQSGHAALGGDLEEGVVQVGTLQSRRGGMPVDRIELLDHERADSEERPLLEHAQAGPRHAQPVVVGGVVRVEDRGGSLHHAQRREEQRHDRDRHHPQQGAGRAQEQEQ